MKDILYILLSLILFSCQPLHNKTTEKKISDNETAKIVEKPNNFKTVKLKLDTTTTFQDKYFDVYDSLFFGLKKFVTDVIMGEDLGFIIFAKDNALSVALIKYENKQHKVIGVTRIPNLKGKEEFVQGRYLKNSMEFTTFGVVELIEGKVTTIRAWKINNKEKCLEQIDPTTVDFTESYNVDPD